MRAGEAAASPPARVLDTLSGPQEQQLLNKLRPDTPGGAAHLSARVASLEAVTSRESEALHQLLHAFVASQQTNHKEVRQEQSEPLEQHLKLTEQLKSIPLQLAQMQARQHGQMMILQEVQEKQREHLAKGQAWHTEIVQAMVQVAPDRGESPASYVGAPVAPAVGRSHASIPPQCEGDGNVDVNAELRAEELVVDTTVVDARSQEVAKPDEVELVDAPVAKMTRASSIKPPPPTGLAAVVESDWFEVVFGGLIILNTIVMAAEMQYLGQALGYELNMPRSSEPASWAKDFFYVLDLIFTIIFGLELIVRIVALRFRFFKSFWGWMDFTVVSIGIADTSGALNVGMDPMMFRLFRLIKLTRCFRMLKMARFLDVFNLIIKSVAASFSLLFWSMLILLVIQWIAGMGLYQLLFPFIDDVSNDEEARKRVFTYYGTFTKTMITMFEVTHVNYSRAARVVMDNVGEVYIWYFIAYRCLVSFAVLQVIRAVFIQQTLKVAERDHDLMLRAKQKQLKEYTHKLDVMFRQMTGSSSGELSLQQFRKVLEDDVMTAWFSAMDMDTHDAENLFHLLDDDKDGGVTVEEFIAGATKLKGAARSIDLFHVSASLKRLEARLGIHPFAQDC